MRSCEWTAWAKTAANSSVPAAFFRGRSPSYLGSHLSNRSVVKWSFQGTAARLYLPKAPGMGVVSVTVDGGGAQNVDLRATTAKLSEVVFEWAENTTMAEGAGSHRHALVMAWRSGSVMPVDCLHFLPPPWK